MNRYLPHEALGLTPRVNMSQLLGMGVAEQAREALASSVAEASAMSMLSSLGPEPNFLGNQYAKHLAMTGLEVDRLGLWPSISEQMESRWDIASIGADLANRMSEPALAAQFASRLLGTHALFGTDSLAKNAALVGSLSNSVAGMF
ncbi:hypothetical protein ABMV15_12040 [Corynebacterium belfantii]|uniref:hypothetical protein n=1 Tax=Corynebacterium belfantii TaxID=2014537 RepID=UPI0035A863AE